MKLAFAGTPEFAKTALSALHATRYEIALVLTQPDRPAGRGIKLSASPVKAFAVEHGINVAQPRGLRLDGLFAADADAARTALEAARPDALIVAAYGLILPPWALALPRLGCLNVHASLLPRWRGAAPVQRAIEAGDEATGVTIMQMDTGLDTGDMLLAEPTPIRPDDTAATLTERLAALGGRLIVEALEHAARGALVCAPQPADGATYANKIGKSEAAIDWSQPAAAIERRVRAFDPFPGATFLLDGEVVKVWRGEVSVALVDARAPGTVLDAGPAGIAVACGSGSTLVLKTLQRPGGRRLDAREFLAGRPLAPGAALGAAA